MGLAWGGFAEFYFDVASSLNLNLELTSPECTAADGTDVWVLKYMLTLALPIFAALAVAVVLGCVFVPLKFLRVAWFAGKTLAELFDAGKRTWYQVMVLLYMPLCAGAFSLFGCRKDVTGRWVLDSAPSRSCYTSTWWSLFVWGLLGVVGYGFGLPAAVVGVLYRARDSLSDVNFVLRYGFLVGRFREDGWYFEALIMVRKLAVVICMTFFFSDLSKAYAAVWALVACLGHLVYFQPYQVLLHNVLAGIVLAAVTLVLHAGTFENEALRNLGVVVGIVVNLGAIVVGNGLDLWRMKRKDQEAEADFYGGGLEEAGQVERGMGTDVGVLSSMHNDVGMKDLSSAGSAEYVTMEPVSVSSIVISQ